MPLSGLNPAEVERIVQTHGIPRWRLEEQREIAEQAARLTQEALAKGMYGPKATEERKAALAAEIAARDRLAPSRAQPFPLKILPGLEISFTAPELIDIAKDYSFARAVYAQSTGISNPSKATIKSFQELVTDTYPGIAMSVAARKETPLPFPPAAAAAKAPASLS